MSLSIPWTSAQLESELGFGASFTSAQLGSAIGAGSYTSAQVAAFNPYTPPSATTDTNYIQAIVIQTGVGSRTLTTKTSVTALPQNGQAPFSYSWRFVSGDPVTIDAPNNASTTCSANVGVNQSKSATIQCQVTDARNNTCLTGAVSVYLELDNNA